MDDKQFRELRTLILDQNVKIEMLVLAIRSLQQRIEELAADPELAPEAGNHSANVYVSDELEELLRTRLPPAPHSDS